MESTPAEAAGCARTRRLNSRIVVAAVLDVIAVAVQYLLLSGAVFFKHS